MKKMITFLAVFALVLALAPATQADIAFFTDSAQLNLAGRDVLAAVNLYAPTNRSGDGTPGHVDVGSIQGKAFTNLDEDQWTRETSPVLTHTVTEGVLTMAGNSKGGRESTDGASGYVAITGDDATEANRLGAAGWFSGNDTTPYLTTFSFNFGAEWASQEVEIQMIGGGTSPKDRLPIFTVSVASDVKGVFIDNDGTADHTTTGAGNPYLMTFTETLDENGDIAIDMTYSETVSGAGDLHIRGVMVTAGPSSSQPFAITEIDYAPDADPNPTVTLTWRSRPNTLYRVMRSTDLSDWSNELVDSIGSEQDENTEDGAHITLSFDLVDEGLDSETDLYFRIEEQAQ
jgi:hypothetical protein